MSSALSLPKVLVVDPERARRGSLMDQLRAHDLEPFGAINHTEAIDLLGRFGISAAMVALGAPGSGGWELIDAVRQATDRFGDLALISMSDAEHEIDVRLSFEHRVDDHISLPAHPEAVAGRVRRLVDHQIRLVPPAPLEVGPLRVDPATRLSSVSGTTVLLTRREFDLLVTLASEPQRVFTRADLLRQVWGRRGGELAEGRTVDSHASRLRRKLAAIDPRPRFIEGVTGIGYRLVPPDQSIGAGIA